jgi:hypothetical protein
MTPIPLNLPDSARLLFNSLFATRDPGLLEQGLVSIVLENGRHIDISWHPEHDPNGAYHLTVYGDTWADQIHTASFDTAEAVATATARAACDYGGRTPLTTIARDGATFDHSTRAEH